MILIFTVVCVDVCRIHSAPYCITIFRHSFRHIVQLPDVDDLRSLGSGLLQRDFHHFQLINVRKLLCSIITHLLSKMSTLGSVALLVPNPQPAGSSCSCTRSRQLWCGLACLPAPSDVCPWTGVQFLYPESLISSSAVSSNFPQLCPLPRCCPQARVYPQPAMYHCLSFARGHCSN